MLEIAYERLRKLKSEGKTAQEAAAAKPLADLETVCGGGLSRMPLPQTPLVPISEAAEYQRQASRPTTL